jgi:hypothetical protein
MDRVIVTRSNGLMAGRSTFAHGIINNVGGECGQCEDIPWYSVAITDERFVRTGHSADYCETIIEPWS